LCLALAACAPGGSPASTAVKTAASALARFNGQLVAPPKVQNQRLKPIFVEGKGNAAPTKDQVKKLLTLTNGQKTGLLPMDLQMKHSRVRKNRKAYSLAGAYFIAQAADADEGLGLVSPAREAKFQLDHPELDDNAPIFEAAGAKNGYYLAAAPDSIDLRDKMPPVRNQGERGTCAHFAISGILDYMYAQQAGAPVKHASPQWLYFLYQALVVSRGSQKAQAFTDTGTSYTEYFPILSAAGNAEVSEDLPYIPPAQGYIDDADAPYVDTPDQGGDFQAMLAKHLPQELRDKLQGGTPVNAQGAFFYPVKNDAATYEAALAGGQPISIGLPVYGDDWNTCDVSTQYRIPDLTPEKAKDGSKVGGHAVVIAGYKRDASAPGGGWFLVRNSWGEDWGDGGYCWISYRMVLDYGDGAHVAQAYAAPFSGQFQLQPGDAPDPNQAVANVPGGIAQEVSYQADDVNQDGGNGIEDEETPNIPVGDDGLAEETGDEGDTYAEDEDD
jgi:hypothetical protein